MNAPEHEEQEAAPLADPDSAVRLRGDPPRVMRLSRKAIGIASACGFAIVGGALIYALQPQGRKGAEELYNTNGVAVADGLSSAPKDYGQVPKLGPPLPGDLGRPILDAQRRGDIAAMPPVGGPQSAAPNPAVNAAEAARQRAEQEREVARGSRLFFGGGVQGNAGTGFASLPAADASPAAILDDDVGAIALLGEASGEQVAKDRSDSAAWNHEHFATQILPVNALIFQ